MINVDKIRITARCIIISKDSILVQVSKKGDRYRLPGGRIKIDETALQTLERELREELGLDLVEAKGPVYIVEAFYKTRRGLVHEIGLYFICKTIGTPEPKESHLKIKWLPLSQLDEDRLRPKRLATLLKNLDKTLREQQNVIYVVSIDS